MVCTPCDATHGSRAIGLGAVQKGAAGAGIASPEDSSWALTNPAALIDVNRRIDVGFDLYYPKREGEPRGPALVLNTQNPEADFVLSLPNDEADVLEDRSEVLGPMAGIVWPVNDKWAVGWGIFGTEGNHVNYPQSRTQPGREIGNGDRRAELGVLKMPVAVAHRFDNGWAVGAAVVGVYSRLRTDSLTVAVRPTRGAFEWDESYGFGLKLGLYKRWDKWSLGAAYLSRQWTSDFDKYDDLIRHGLDLPQEFRIGFAYRPRKKWEILADYQFINWSGVAQIGNSAVRSGLGWEDQHIFKLGLRWRPFERLTLRVGASYGKSPIPDDGVFANILFPAATEMHAAAGFSLDISPKHAVHFAYIHAFEKEMTDNGAGDLFSMAGEGSVIRMHQNSFSVQYSFSF
jgi:long-chain fatty acid transport protein